MPSHSNSVMPYGTPVSTGPGWTRFATKKLFEGGWKVGQKVVGKYLKDREYGERMRRIKQGHDIENQRLSDARLSGRKSKMGPVNALVNKSAKRVRGKVRVKKTKRVKVSPKLRSAIKQVIAGNTANGTYSRVTTGFVGTMTASQVGVPDGTTITGDFSSFSQIAVTLNSSANVHGRTLFNQLASRNVGGTSNLISGSGLNFFTAGKIMDAAAVLFNNKLPSFNPYDLTGNLTTRHSTLTGSPVVSQVGSLKINVLKSYVRFTLKNVSDRVVEMDIWEMTPTLKFCDNNPLAELDSLFDNQAESSVVATNFSYYSGANVASVRPGLAQYEAHYDPLAVAKRLFGYKWTWKKRSMVLGPDETCTHSINGPSGVLDCSKLIQTSSNPTIQDMKTRYVKGFSVGVVISVVADMVKNAAGNSAGGRKNMFIAAANAVLGSPIAVEYEEVMKIAVPEVVGFLSPSLSGDAQAVASQQLNFRKHRDVFWNSCEPGALSYTNSNEENPFEDATMDQDG